MGSPTSVIIIGAGPVGLATAYVLGRHGVRSVVCERYEGINPHPRAHVINTRSMELLRGWGIADAVTADALQPDPTLSVVWKQSVAGLELGRIELTQDQLGDRTDASPVSTVSCAQDRFQRHLLEAVLRQGMAEVRFGSTVTAIHETADGVEVEINGADVLNGAYLVAADGAASTARALLDIELDGLPDLGRQINVYFHADLSRWTNKDPVLLFWVLNSAATGVFVCMGDHVRWTFNFAFDPTAESLADYTPERCADLIRTASGIPDLAVDVRSVGTWTIAATAATHYRRGRVFLTGDAAHQFPPTGGFGMNTGLADADNLAWKLAAVINGWADTTLLDTYESERRPVALANAKFSLDNVLKMVELGFGPDADEVAARLEDPVAAPAERARLAEIIPLQRLHFGSLNQELGYGYDGTAPDASARFTPSTAHGARLPHAWVTHQGNVVSTHDLLGPGLTLLTGTECDAWNQAFSRTGVPGGCVRTQMDRLGLDERAALLVRPDGHIAWRTEDPGADPVAALAAAITDVTRSVLLPLHRATGE